MTTLDLAKVNWQDDALKLDGPTCLVITARLEPVAGMDRFQPTGFPEIGHVVYDAPRSDGRSEKVCIVDSPASMANHLESLCLDGPTGGLCPDLEGMPYVRCVTDKEEVPAKDDTLDTLVCNTLTEGHRLASDYFLDGLVELSWQEAQPGKKGPTNETIPAHRTGNPFRESLRTEFTITEVQKGKTYFILPETWWNIFKTLFQYDPNSLVHGVMFAKEQIKISRLLTSHLEAFGAARVGRSGVKFDRLGKTTSGQPIFAVDEATAREIRATFVLDLALLRSYGREKDKGLKKAQKRFLLDFAIWKISRLLERPFRFRTGCHLICRDWTCWTEAAPDKSNTSCGEKQATAAATLNEASKKIKVDIKTSIRDAEFAKGVTSVYYPRADLFQKPADTPSTPEPSGDDSPDTSED